MFANYPAIYRGAHGEEAIAIQNDGKSLRTTIRGVEFKGSRFEDFRPSLAEDDPRLSPFVINRYDYGAADLCGCVIECDIQLPVVMQEEVVTAVLHVFLDLGVPDDRHIPDHETLRLSLILEGVTYSGSGESGWFEDEMLEIQASLPAGVVIKSCINCAFSDYSVYGHSMFGDLNCFRNCKSKYLAVTDKGEYMGLRCPGGTFDVQETYLCPEFERRQPGTGYRG